MRKIDLTNQIDYTDKTIRYLTGIEPLRLTRHGNVVWNWRCICGKVVAISETCVRSGRYCSCGCIKNNTPKQQRFQLNSLGLTGTLCRYCRHSINPENICPYVGIDEDNNIKWQPVPGWDAIPFEGDGDLKGSHFVNKCPLFEEG